MKIQTLLICSLLALGCKSQVQLTDSYNMKAKPIAVGDESLLAKDKNITVFILENSDERQNKKMGQAAGVKVTMDKTEEWMNDALKSLSGYGYTVKFAEKIPEGKNGIGIKFYLKKFYMDSVATSKSAHIVAKVDYFENSMKVNTEIIRATRTYHNWNSGKGEVTATFRYTLQELMQKLAQNILSNHKS